MGKQIEHFGWLVSPYSAKTRSYLKYKRIPFKDVEPNIFDFYTKIQKSVGRIIMPTLRLPDGTWLQDSSDIIDKMESAHPNRSITPDGTIQTLVALLFELYGDEWLPMAALHYRWNIPANEQFALKEFSRCALPIIPAALGKLVIQSMAKKMQSYLPVLGVTKTTQPGVEKMVTRLIADLNTHLSVHPFLLGGRPCIGDFALFGPLWAHLYRDPGSTFLFDDAPHVVSWLEKLLDPTHVCGDFLANDEIPETLLPLLKGIFDEQILWVAQLIGHINQWCHKNPDSKRVRGAVGVDNFSVGGIAGERKLATFVQWKAQRSIFFYQQSSESVRTQIDGWLESLQAAGALDIDIQFPLELRNFKAVITNR
ncbi:MAG: glutathione S-transferase family protein [Deltaproteobacteria bacterium]|nr:glutathione S-transferase family protein [Deltaproteobacteria bacterium]